MNHEPTNTGYSRIEVQVPNKYAPKNLKDYHFECDENTLITLGVSSAGRLSKMPLYLESRALAELFRDYLNQLFTKRAYCDTYSIVITDVPFSKSKMDARRKLQHSKKVCAKLGI